MLLILLAAVLAGLAVLVRRIGGRAAPTRSERLYIVAAPIPVVVTIVAPAAIVLLGGDGAIGGTWLSPAGWLGVILSGVLLVIGVVLIVRATSRGSPWGWPLGVAVVLAATPVAIVALTYMLWLLASALV